MNHGIRSTLAQELSVAMISASSKSPLSAIARSGSSGHESLQSIDERPTRRFGVTRRALFEELDRPNLKSLPAQPYCFAEWRIRRVGVDYHLELEGHFYSVPYRLPAARSRCG